MDASELGRLVAFDEKKCRVLGFWSNEFASGAQVFGRWTQERFRSEKHREGEATRARRNIGFVQSGMDDATIFYHRLRAQTKRHSLRNWPKISRQIQRRSPCFLRRRNKFWRGSWCSV